MTNDQRSILTLFLVGDDPSESFIFDVDESRFYVRADNGEVHWQPSSSEGLFEVTDPDQLVVIDRYLVTSAVEILTDVAIVITDLEQSEPHLFYSKGA